MSNFDIVKIFKLVWTIEVFLVHTLMYVHVRTPFSFIV